ncbi:Bergaptol O-methyltransferase [Platanthera guangdongensis]|uniref:Bergaptol O-methyltransferase n=1 Tax=Platanthera guangdongensis TaxID=2320717 RepID=A0ABR2MIS1_9ASPA
MFDMIPKWSTISMQWILHNWNDEQCLTILKNCLRALRPAGKVIVLEYILPEVSNVNLDAREAYAIMNMMILFDGAKERTEKEFRSFAPKASFSEFKISCNFLKYNVMELVK